MNWMMMDMNSFFASAEQHFRPELRGRPVGVVPVESDGACVIAASYDAKRRGVSVGTNVREARRLCPEITFVKARPKVYVQLHHELLRCVDRRAEIDRVYSIDEWTIRLRGDERKPETARKLAEGVKQAVRDEFGSILTCSIGVAPTRLLAKMACGLKKPDGLTLLDVDDMPDRLEGVPLGGLFGVSDGMLARFDRHGVRSVRDLWEMSERRAVEVWGSVVGARWWAGFHGRDEPDPPPARRSMSHGNVLDPRFRNEAGAHGILVRLVCKLARRLRQGGWFADVLQLSVRDVRGGSFSDKITLPCAHDTPTLLLQFEKLWRRRTPTGRPILKVEVCVVGLVAASQVARPLFDDMEKPLRVSRAMDEINDRWGGSTIYFGGMHDHRHPMDDKIAFGRIPDPVP
ncbi:MAG: Y-family DNA polymerase, partial [Planctomycetia bacterium]